MLRLKLRDDYGILQERNCILMPIFLVGRNGMLKYNNQDHPMLAARTAVDNIVNDASTKENIWAINTEMDYDEEKAAKS